VAASPKSERVDPPGSPATSTSAPGNKKVELKPVSPPVRPEPQKALADECKACQGAHRAHTVSCPAVCRAPEPKGSQRSGHACFVAVPLTRCSYSLHSVASPGRRQLRADK
jgi:hypothetical protein